MVRHSLAFPALLAVMGCAQVLGIDDTTLEDDAGHIDAASSAADAAPVSTFDAGPPDAQFVCADQTLEPPLGESGFDTTLESNDQTVSCGDSASSDIAFAWTAPVTDYYQIDTFGSSFDTVLAVRDDCDAASELECSNNVGALPQSEIVRKFEQGDDVVVIVDGFATDSGAGLLSIERVSCPDLDLEDVALPAPLTTFGQGDDLSSECGGDGFEDRAYHWVPPVDGLYEFVVTADTFTPAIRVFDGPRCGDAALSCGAASEGERGAYVVRRLTAGQVVGIEVDGVDGEGPFSIDIKDRGGPACPEGTLPEGSGFAGTMTSRSLAPSCGFAHVTGTFGGGVDIEDFTVSFEADFLGEGCFGGCTVTASADHPIILYALDGANCDGSEIACVTSTEASPGTHQAGIDVPMVEGETKTYTVVVANAAPGDPLAFDVFGQCAQACP